jgi:hypothetical protein
MRLARQPPGSKMTVSDTWTLHGHMLTVQRHSKSSFGDSTTTLVFQKQ